MMPANGCTLRPDSSSTFATEALLKNGFELIGVSPLGANHAGIPLAAANAGESGLLDLTYARDCREVQAALDAISASPNVRPAGRLGVILAGRNSPFEQAVLSSDRGLHTILLVCEAGESEQDLQKLVGLCRTRAERVGLVVTTAAEAEQALRLGLDCVVAKGHEAGGLVGEETSFILLQRLCAWGRLPVLVWGGIGLHTARACRAAGAAGAVLDWQLSLTRESALPEPLKRRLAGNDGSETVALATPDGRYFRLLYSLGMTARGVLENLAEELKTAPDAGRWRAAIETLLTGRDLESGLWAIGQDAALAVAWSERAPTVARALKLVRRHLALPSAEGAAESLVVDSPLARSHGTQFPIVQGPMTRVSDVPGFCRVVADGGGLPFLALAMMRAPAVRGLLQETQGLLGDLPWGVGILGFAERELRAEQLAVVEELRPPYAIISGGRADQAAALESKGIRTYLHVPSPTMLDSFLREGARRFIFEGRECGGHVGPRSSFVLWEQMLEVLLQARLAPAEAAEVHVLFAGGIHDARSGAVISSLAAPLAALGMKVGVLLGTAYLFTQEAVETGAIVPSFQDVALTSTGTALVETGPGHAIRCAETQFVRFFGAERTRLKQSAAAGDAVREELESLTVGRLRIASKGITRGESPRSAEPFVQLPEDEQRRQGMYMIGQLAALRDRRCSIRELHEGICPAASSPAAWYVAESESQAQPVEAGPPPFDVAVVGMSCLMPQAQNIDEFWWHLLQKHDLITEIPADRFDASDWFDADRRARDKIYSQWGGFLGDIPFDPLKYGIPPNTLRNVEPGQLLALELVSQALADAGYGKENPHRERTGIILGASGGLAEQGQNYVFRSLLPRFLTNPDETLFSQLPEWTEDSFPGLLPNVLAGRVSNRLDLGGTNLTVDAACASSLAAVYLACRDLADHSSDAVIAGGVDIVQNVFAYLCFSKTGALSPRGRSRTFDASADGIAISEGLAAVVLKRREDAERDGDRIYAVIRGVAAGSDGRHLSLTAPSSQGQIRTLERAYRQAGFGPETVELFEAHGTGTSVGDQTECRSLAEVLETHGSAPHSTAIGSLKSNFGHAKSAAGVAGLIKAVLALYHRVLPPTIGVEQPNPKAGLDAGPLYVNSELRPWLRGEHPRRAGVSAFGFGGTNFHAVLEEHAAQDELTPRQAVHRQRPAELFVFSARSLPALRTRVQEFAGELRNAQASGRTLELAALAFTQHVRAGRPAGEFRAAVVTGSVTELLTQLQSLADGIERENEKLPAGVWVVRQPAPRGAVAYLFPGQGSQYPDMGRELAVEFPEVAAAFERADRTLSGRFEQPLSRYVFPPPAFTAEEKKKAVERLKSTDVTQPALGACEVGLLRLLESLRLAPDMVAGHSYGELVALHAAGALAEESLLRLSWQRGAAIVEMSRAAGGTDLGQMLAVQADAGRLTELLKDCAEVWPANLNSPRQTVISGTSAGIARAQAVLQAAGVSSAPIPTGCGFHSPLMEPARQRFEQALHEVHWQPLQRPVYGNVTAAEHAGSASEIREVLSQQLVRQVRFVEQIQAMHAAGARIFIEVGPGQVLSKLVSHILRDAPHVAVPLNINSTHSYSQLLSGLAELFVHGVDPDLERLYDGRRLQRLDLRQLATAAPALPAHWWLVNGSYARPASEPKRIPKPTASMRIVQDPSPAEPLTVAAETPTTPPSSMTTPPSSMTTRPSMTARTSTPDLEVHAQFQETMRQFLRTQQAVLQAYLGAPGAVAANSTPVAQPAPAIHLQPTRAARIETNGSNGSHAEGNSQTSSPSPAAARNGHGTNGHSNSSHTASSHSGNGHTGNGHGGNGHGNGQNGDGSANAQSTNGHTLSAKSAGGATTNGETSNGATNGSTANGHGHVKPAASAPATPGPETSLSELQALLLETVSTRTGYPVDMLGLDAQLEADLGIDSIKRVEIIGAFRRQVTAQNSEPPAWFMDKMSEARTLRAILNGVVELRGLAAKPAPAAAPVAAAAVAAEPAARPVTPVAGSDELLGRLLEIVAARTGYPISMLDIDVGLEADLGIDSIKRVEIIGEYRRSILPQGTEPPAWFLDRMSAAKTLRAILDGINALLASLAGGSIGAAPLSPAPTVVASTSSAQAKKGHDKNGHDKSGHSSHDNPAHGRMVAGVNAPAALPASTRVTLAAPRCVAQVVEAPLHAAATLSQGLLVVIDSECGLAQPLLGELQAARHETAVIRAFELATRAGAEAAVQRIRHDGPLAGIINCVPLRRVEAFPGLSAESWQSASDLELRGMLHLLQAIAPELSAGLPVLCLTRGGGDFGGNAATEANCPWRGGLAGLLKTAAREWPRARLRALDVDNIPDSRLVLRELAADGPVEVGYRAGKRLTIRAVQTELAADAAVTPALKAGDVVLVTGGARGITAEIVREIAQHSRATLILLGRSALPAGEEPESTRSLVDPTAIRLVLLAEAKKRGTSPSIREIEAGVRHILAGREIQATLADVRRAGATVEYHACDIRDAAALTQVVRDVQQRLGGIDGVLHGAGLIEDKLIVDKTDESFDRVLGTKIDPLLTLIPLLDPQRLKMLMLFSSVSGIIGNRGQGDYAAANEILNRIGARLARLWPGKVVSLNWGPWEGTGMVTPEVARELASRQIGLVSVDEGRRAAWNECLHPAGADVRVVIGPGHWVSGAGTPAVNEPAVNGSAHRVERPVEAAR